MPSWQTLNRLLKCILYGNSNRKRKQNELLLPKSCSEVQLVMCNLRWITWKPHHDTYISGQFIVILLWRMIWFIPTSGVPSPPAVPKYNMQSTDTLSILVWSWEASGLRRCLPSNDPCSTSVTFSNNPERSLVSSSTFCPSWVRTRQGLLWMSSRPWAVQGKTSAHQPAGPSLIKGAKYPARLEAIHLQLECYSPKIQGLFLCSSGLSLFSNEPWCDSLEMTKGDDSETVIRGHCEQPLMITQQAGLAHKLMLLVHMSRCGVMNQWHV